MAKNQPVEDKTYGDLILVCGDFHIPFRKDKVPEKIKALFGPNKIQHVVCTGNVGNSETLDFYKSLSPNFHGVRGEYDETLDISQDVKMFQVGQWKFVLVHGHQVIPWGDEDSLNIYTKEQDSDVVISGHTHIVRVSKLDRKTFLNPGSITGAYGPYKADIDPSFLVLEVMGNELGIFQYTLVNQEFLVEKTVINK